MEVSHERLSTETTKTVATTRGSLSPSAVGSETAFILDEKGRSCLMSKIIRQGFFLYKKGYFIAKSLRLFLMITIDIFLPYIVKFIP